MKHLLFALLAVLLCTPVFADDDAKALQGTWKAQKGELGGHPFPAEALKGITLKIDGGNYVVTVSTDPRPDKGTYTLDPTAKPKKLTIKGVEGANQGKTILAIYDLQGDTLEVCYDVTGMNFPTAMSTTEGSPLFHILYQRSK